MYTIRNLFYYWLLATILFSCGSLERNRVERNRAAIFRIGIDASWSPLDFGEQQPYVNGYIEDLLLEIARDRKIQFEKISANWSSLFQGLYEDRYDAVLSSFPPYAYNVAKYDFSKNLLNTGPVLIVAQNSSISTLDGLSDHMVGIVTGMSSALLLEQHAKIIIRSYDTIPALLNAVVRGDIQAALLDRLPATAYTKDMYADRLKIASSPLTEDGLHAVAIKSASTQLIEILNRSLDQLNKKKRMQALQKKWNLDES